MDSTIVAVSVTISSLLVLLLFLYNRNKKSASNIPAIPGFPLIGNLLQLKAKKPYQTFAKWAETYGPIFSVKLGSSTLVVINSTELAKEAMVTKFSSISTRALSNALKLLTAQKSIVAMADYGEYHKMAKRYILSSVLGAAAQKRHRGNRDTMIDNILNSFFADIAEDPHNAVNLRKHFKNELFRLALKQALGKDVESVFVEELGVTISKEEIFQFLVVDPMMGAIEVDWRDFFPYMKWVPNKSLETKINGMAMRQKVVTKALIMEQKKRIARGEAIYPSKLLETFFIGNPEHVERDERFGSSISMMNIGVGRRKKINCYLDYLVSEESTLTEDQLNALVWESIIETSDTTLVTSEWAMYELAKNPEIQDRLYREILEVCGSEKITEEHLQKMPYLNAVFHETLRFHSPVSVIPPRYIHEDVQLGGYNVPAGTEVVINLYACNMDKKDWEEPGVWNPDRFLSSKYDQMDLYKTMAFGGGKRVCAGSLQAYLISCTAIGRFVQEFRWRLKEGEEEDVDTVQLTTHKLHPMHAYITPRESYVPK